ncbi:hypothetical protein L596_028575 [Steinernema carpocapsae]|uniref:Uncharacterized protein n=1 Tax=Steinernema carpocapsae TaxID=34508 RepID=A0A4U5LYT9_STECR|nr:hypothetical protein L596_028575 [Steinernema carpocapsae]
MTKCPILVLMFVGCVTLSSATLGGYPYYPGYAYPGYAVGYPYSAYPYGGYPYGGYYGGYYHLGCHSGCDDGFLYEPIVMHTKRRSHHASPKHKHACGESEEVVTDGC